jgi:hypothetical protein
MGVFIQCYCSPAEFKAKIKVFPNFNIISKPRTKTVRHRLCSIWGNYRLCLSLFLLLNTWNIILQLKHVLKYSWAICPHTTSRHRTITLFRTFAC